MVQFQNRLYHKFSFNVKIEFAYYFKIYNITDVQLVFRFKNKFIKFFHSFPKHFVFHDVIMCRHLSSASFLWLLLSLRLKTCRV